jgi:transposase
MTQVSGNSTRGKPARAIASYMQTALTQLAHAAARAKETYLSTLYQRLAAGRRRKRAIIAVAHALRPYRE